MELNFNINKINLDLLKTNRDFRQEAKKRLDQVIIEIGESFALKKWIKLKQEAVAPTPTTKNLFIRLGGQNFKNSLNKHERKYIEDLICESLKTMKKEEKE